MTPITPAAAATVFTISSNDAKAQRLHKAAHQFEAMMLSEMLKPLAQAGEDALNGPDSTGSSPLQSFGMEAVAGALSNSNALGFAKQIERALLGHTPGTKAAQTPPSGVDDECTKVSETH